jgi:hypothetical protein
MNSYDDIFNLLGGDLKLATLNIKNFLNKGDNKKKFLSGLKDGSLVDDKVKINSVSVSCKSLQPSQNAIYLDKSLGITMTNPTWRDQILSGSFPSESMFISKDNYIIDGHHRWSSAMMANPNCKIICTQISLPIKEAILILNAILIAINKWKNETGSDRKNIWKINTTKEIAEACYDLADYGLQDSKGTFFVGPIEYWSNQPNSLYPTPSKELMLDNYFKDIAKENWQQGFQVLLNRIKKIPQPKSFFGSRKEMPQLDNAKNILPTLAHGNIDITMPLNTYENKMTKNQLKSYIKNVIIQENKKKKFIVNIIKEALDNISYDQAVKLGNLGNSVKNYVMKTYSKKPRDVFWNMFYSKSATPKHLKMSKEKAKKLLSFAKEKKDQNLIKLIDNYMIYYKELESKAKFNGDDIINF